MRTKNFDSKMRTVIIPWKREILFSIKLFE